MNADYSRLEFPTVSGQVITDADAPTNAALQRAKVIAWLTDDLVAIPGTNVRVGADAVIGLIPGVGDVLATGLASMILMESVRARVPLHVLGRMGLNLAIDPGLGIVPVVGDVLDAAHRANAKNARLLEKTISSGKQVNASAKGYAVRAGLVVGAIIAAMVAMLVLTIWGLLALLGMIF